MIATIGLPGTSAFRFKHFALRGRALTEAVDNWRAAWLRAVRDSEESRNAVRQGTLLTDAEARRERYRSGARIYSW